MNLLHVDAPLALALLGWCALLPFVLLSLLALRRPFLPDATAQHVWLAAVVGLAFLWMAQVRTGEGLHFGMLGATLMALLFGRARAMLGLLLALTLHTALTQGSWTNWGLNGLLLAALPVWATTALQQRLEQWLPKNLFIFIIGNGMFVTLAVTAATSLLLTGAAAWQLASADSPALSLLTGDAVGYSLLLAWGESLVSGMMFSALVIFAPTLVLTYREDLYLPRRRKS